MALTGTAFRWEKEVLVRKAYIVSPDPGLVFGSADPVAAEAFALALPKDLKMTTPSFARGVERLMLYQNPNAQELPTIPIRKHPYIRHVTEMGLGEVPSEVVYEEVPGAVKERLDRSLE